MSLEVDLFAALKSLVSNRVYPVMFPQPAQGVPVWPAIRYTIDTNPEVDLEGDGDDTTAQQSVQLDGVATTYAGMRSLRLSIMNAMTTFDPPALLQLSLDDYDTETKTYRCILTYEVYGSSDPLPHSPV